jgi:CubicO group peptidase (beta-lactamase class C family)
MSRRTKLGAMVSALSAGLFNSACAAQVLGHQALAGRWGAFLAIGASGLRLELEIGVDQPVILYSPDQGNARIPATKGRCTATEVDVEFGAVRAKLKVALSRAGHLVGQFQQGAQRPIEFTRLATGADPARPVAGPFGDLQGEVDAARTKFAIPALGAAYMSVKDRQAKSGEAVSGVLVQGEATPIARALKWHVGSITKSMTATLVARLVERGLINWDAKLSALFGTMAPDMLPAYADITLAQLMTGNSRLPTNIGMPDFMGHITSTDTPTQRRSIWVRQAFKMPPVTGAAAGFVYPNNGYVLAGALCEAVTGKNYEALMQEEVFAPLGITSAGFGPPTIGNPQGHRRALIGGRLLGVGVESAADNPAAMAPAGRAHMTLADLARFGLAHSEGHQGLKNDYLKQETWRFLHAPPRGTTPGSDYAFGWIVRSDGTLWHNGSNTYWLAELAFDPRNSLSACAGSNVAQADEAVGRVLGAALATGAK